VYAHASVSNNQQDMNHLAGDFFKSFFNNSFAKMSRYLMDCALLVSLEQTT
jgi:hypothetical protein